MFASTIAADFIHTKHWTSSSTLHGPGSVLADSSFQSVRYVGPLQSISSGRASTFLENLLQLNESGLSLNYVQVYLAPV